MIHIVLVGIKGYENYLSRIRSNVAITTKYAIVICSKRPSGRGLLNLHKPRDSSVVLQQLFFSGL